LRDVDTKATKTLLDQSGFRFYRFNLETATLACGDQLDLSDATVLSLVDEPDALSSRKRAAFCLAGPTEFVKR